MNIYRVRARTTSSLQPGESHWHSDVLYCGTDKTSALCAFYASQPQDTYQGHGNRARETLLETVDADSVEDPSNPPGMEYSGATDARD